MAVPRLSSVVSVQKHILVWRQSQFARVYWQTLFPRFARVRFPLLGIERIELSSGVDFDQESSCLQASIPFMVSGPLPLS